jgi:polysaccharide pyruvyl transferase WcaK-like protein
MRIVIVDAFERGNRGDAALLSVMIDQVAEANPGAEILVAGFEDPKRWPLFDGRRNIGSMRRYVGEEKVGRVNRIIRKALVALVALLAANAVTRRLLIASAGALPPEVRRELLAVTSADLVVALGGGYLNARDDLASDLSIFFLLLPVWLAQRAGVPVVFGPQSYGPFPRDRQRRMVRRVLSSARAVVVREDISVGRLDEAGVDPAPILRGVDSAFAFTGRSTRPWRTELGIPADATLVVATARQWLAPEEQQRYEQSLVDVYAHVLEHDNHYVVIVPQVTCAFQDDDDRIVNKRIAAQLDHPRLLVVTDDGFDHHDAHALYAAADFIIGTRFHSVIFGLTATVPCLAIEYDHKTRGIMRDLGLEEWVIGIKEARGDLLIALIDKLFAAREGYVADLGARLPDYRQRAADVLPLLAASGTSHQARQHVA